MDNAHNVQINKRFRILYYIITIMAYIDAKQKIQIDIWTGIAMTVRPDYGVVFKSTTG